MTTYNHTPITPNTPANSADANPPLGQLDAAIGNRTTLGTPTKTNLVGAINDLWNEIITTRGSSLSLSDFFLAFRQQLQTNINAVNLLITPVADELTAARGGYTALKDRLTFFTDQITLIKNEIGWAKGLAPEPSGTQTWGSSVPLSGTFDLGSIRWNNAPTIARNISHWRCVATGTPGTWRAFGTGRGQTSERPALVPNDTGYTYWDITLGKFIHWNGASWDV